MRKYYDFHETKWALKPVGTNSPAPQLFSTTSISAYGFGRAKFTFLLGDPGTGASFTNAIIMKATASGATYETVTALPSMVAAAASTSVGYMMVVDFPLGANASGTAYSWLLVSSASISVSSWPLFAIVDLYNCYIHPPTNATAQVNRIITI
jgi:hypothetical protein